uniref:Uncharacterized protein n=1 Tax=Anguilla anguilla TaxID=7936 RepID=A0A0E9UPA7_ANGAN
MAAVDPSHRFYTTVATWVSRPPSL